MPTAHRGVPIDWEAMRWICDGGLAYVFAFGHVRPPGATIVGMAERTKQRLCGMARWHFAE